MDKVTERFLRFVKINTQSDYKCETFPSTKTQLEFGQYLKKECENIGLSDVYVCEKGYVYATLPSNCKELSKDVIGFISHMDTSPDCSGENVKPRIVENYDGGNIVLNEVENIILSPDEFVHLSNYKGQDLIVTDGKTLLGADDKAGIAEILTAAEFFLQNPEILHCEMKICFTPDEEVGHGADFFDVKRFGADFAYTVDGGEIGELEYESFNAARAKFCVKGKSVHPGYAKGIMINAANVAVEIINEFPKDEVPSKTELYEGYFHLNHFEANVEEANFDFTIRDFFKESFAKRKDFVIGIFKKYLDAYGQRITLNLYDEYYNMKEVLADKLYIVDRAEKVMEKAGVTAKIRAIRGGTDGSRLSFMGLPCPNIFAGGHNFHGPYEYVPIESLEKAVEVIVGILKV